MARLRIIARPASLIAMAVVIAGCGAAAPGVSPAADTPQATANPTPASPGPVTPTATLVLSPIAESPTATRTANPTASVAPSPSLLPGDPVPPELSHGWHYEQRSLWMRLDDHTYTFDQPDSSVRGNVVVNGDEIAFFNGSMCNEPLPDGVGRYRWTIGDEGLLLTPVGADQCAGRSAYLANHIFTRR